MHYTEAVFNSYKLVEDAVLLGFTGQLELCPTTERLHLQAALRAPKRCTATALAAELRAYDPYWHSVHLVGAPVADLQTLANYSNKTATRADPNALPWTHGVVAVEAPNGRTGEEEVRSLVRAGATWRGLLESDSVRWSTLAQLGTVLPRALALYQPRRDGSVKPEVYLMVGASGTGKSVMTRALCEEKGWKPYTLPLDAGGHVSFVTEDICGADTLIFSDFRGQGISMTAILNLVDRGEYQMQTKGGMVHVCATRFIFNSNVEPDKWWAGVKEKDEASWQEKYDALKRRFDEWRVPYNYKLAFRAWRLEQRMTAPLAPMWEQDATRVIVPEDITAERLAINMAESVISEH